MYTITFKQRFPVHFSIYNMLTKHLLFLFMTCSQYSTAPPSTSILEPTDLPVTASVDTVQIISKDGGDKAATAVAQNGQPSDSTESGSSVDTTSDPTITHNDNGVVDDVAVPRPHFMDVLESSDIFKNMSNSWREDTAQQILAIANLVELEHRVATAVPPRYVTLCCKWTAFHIYTI